MQYVSSECPRGLFVIGFTWSRVGEIVNADLFRTKKAPSLTLFLSFLFPPSPYSLNFPHLSLHVFSSTSGFSSTSRYIQLSMARSPTASTCELKSSISRAGILGISSAFNMATDFFSLPQELMDMVAEYLDTGDLRSLRLSSRSLRDYFLFIFVKRYLRVRCHLMTLDSLACLVAISRYAVFGRAMHTLVIPDSVVGSLHGTEKSTAKRDFIHEPGLVGLYLIEVFKNAVSCRTVRAVESVYPCRYWGAAALERENGQSGWWWYKAPIHCRVGIRQSIIVALTESGAPICSQ